MEGEGGLLYLCGDGVFKILILEKDGYRDTAEMCRSISFK